MDNLFKEAVKQHSSDIALQFGNQRITYRELDELSDRIAQQIIESGHTLEESPFIGLYSSRTLYTIPMMLGIWKAGFAYVPIDRRNNIDRMNLIISDSDMRLVLTDCGIPEGISSSVEWKEIGEQLEKQDTHGAGNGNDTAFTRHSPISRFGKYAYLIYTSGTTGTPKGTPITHASLRHLALGRQQLIPSAEDHMDMTLASIGFDASVWEIFPALMTGTPVYFTSEEEKARPELIVDIVERLGITTINLTPTYLALLPYRKLPSLRFMVTGGEVCPLQLIRLWQQTCTIINAYGPTENTVTTTACILTADSLPNDIGLPMPGVVCYVLNKQQQPVADGEKGELYIGGPQLSEGYLRRPELTAEKFIANPFVDECPSAPVLYATGDVVSRQPNGHLLFFGRKDSQVKIHGIRIELEEVKVGLEACQSVEHAAVEVVHNEQYEYLRAYVKMNQFSDLPKDDSEISAAFSVLKAEVARRVPSYMIPAQFVFVPQIPLTINGKTDFNALHQFLPTSQESDQVKGRAEQELAALWHEVIDSPVSIHSDSHFMALGGDSLAVIRLLLKVNEQYHLSLSLTDIQEHLELSDMASWLAKTALEEPRQVTTEDRQASAAHTEVQESRSSNRVPLSMHLQNLFVHCLLSEQASVSYNLVDLIPFGDTVDEQKLLSAWNQLLTSQDALRMTFHQDKDGNSYLETIDFQPITTIDRQSVDSAFELKTAVEHQLTIPFNLSEGPLYRLTLYHEPQSGWQLAVFIHHLITDGWSSGVLRRQLYDIYHGEEVADSASYADYVFAESQQEKSDFLKQSADYWSAYMDEVAKLQLPNFMVGNGNDDDLAAQCLTFGIPNELFLLINQYCARHHLTPFSLFSSALMLMLYRISRQSDFFIAYPVSGREQTSFANTMGYFVRPCPLKFRESWLDDSFPSVCQQVMDDVRTAIKYPYATMRLPLVSFTLEPAMQANRLDVRPAFTMTPLTLTVDVADDGMCCRWIYQRALFDEKAVALFNHCFQALIENLVVEHDRKAVRSASMIDKTEYSRQVELNTIDPLRKPEENIIDLFLRQVASRPDHLALKDESCSYTYQQLDEASRRVAASLLSDGLPVGAVGIYSDRSSQSLATILGIIRAGCYYVPLNDSYPKERLLSIIADSGMQRMVTTHSMKPMIESIESSVRVYLMEEMLEASDNCISLPQLTTSTPAYMIYTSGTTGKPKGVVVPHSSVVSMVTIGAPGVYCPTSDDRIIQFSTYIFDASVIDIFCSLLTGATLITAPESMKKEPDSLFQLMEREQITWACIPPAFLHSCHKDAPPSLKTFLVGGESPSQEIISRYSNIRFINGYGPTENTVCSTSHTYGSDTTQDSNCIGRPLRGVTCYVMDDDHNLLPDGISGELYLGGLQLATGYHKRSKLNSKVFIDNPFASKADLEQGLNTRLYATGDMVCRKADGLLYFMGRKDFQVKLRGYRIELADIESTLLSYPDVQQCVVEVRQMGDAKQLAAHIETFNSQLSADALRAWLSERLPSYMIPNYWSFSEHFPLTHNGKIDRSRLPEPQICGAVSADNEELLEVERRCRFAISTIVGVEADSIDVNADLMEDIGMNSLQILEYVSQMQARGFQLHASDVYHCKTVRKLANRIESNKEPLTQEQIDGRAIYFYTPDNRYKPLLIICSGTPYFEAFYMNFYRAFKDDYTILVIESPSEFYSLRPDFPMETDALMAEYARILRPILKDRTTPILTTGLCLGGDMALRLAVELDAESIATPTAVIIDGYACRSKYGSDTGGMVVEPGISEEVVLFRNKVLHAISGSFVQRYYAGPAHLILCTEFDDEPGQTREEGIAFFPINKANWKESQPDIPITYVSSVHMQMVHDPENLRIIKQIIDSYAFA